MMITVFSPCECGGEPIETSKERIFDVACVNSRCNSCGKIIRDCYEIKFIGRLYPEEGKSQEQKIKRIK